MEFSTSKGIVITIDDSDYEIVSGRRWNIYPNGYAYRHITLPDGKKTTRMLHRILMDLAPGDSRCIDHINGNRLDNRRCNLRLCNHSENSQNKKMQSNNTSGYKGVTYQPSRLKYQARIKYKSRQKHLGLFETAELAHEFYCLAADMLFGKYSNHGSHNAT